jgi:hypothetical protein
MTDLFHIGLSIPIIPGLVTPGSRLGSVGSTCGALSCLRTAGRRESSVQTMTESMQISNFARRGSVKSFQTEMQVLPNRKVFHA